MKQTGLREEMGLLPLTEQAVRTAMLAAQGLHSSPEAPASKADLLPVIRQLGYLQIDTIQVVRRSQHLVLWSRLGDFDPDWLDEIHAQGHLFEYYAHALCYLPIEDYPIFRGRMLYDKRVGNGWQKWAAQHPEIVNTVRSIIYQEGPVCSADFDSQTIATGWGAVKQEKLALQRLFATGDLMVPFRRNFRRYYDLRERVLPDWDDANALDAAAGFEALLLKTVHALGVAREDWAAPYYYFPKTGLAETLVKLVKAGRLVQVQVQGWEQPAYVHPDQLPLINACAAGELKPNHTTFLSPFDPLVSDRSRALALFGFDYKMESYTPVKDRKFGYFCLPILHKDRLVGRLDPKAHRKEHRMEFKQIFLESGVKIDYDLVNALKDALDKFTRWHGMTDLQVTATQPLELREALL